MHMDMLFINTFLFIKAGSPRSSAVQPGAAVQACLLREKCALPLSPALLHLTRGTRKDEGPGQGQQDPEIWMRTVLAEGGVGRLAASGGASWAPGQHRALSGAHRWLGKC